jgi:hypothetical protein
VLQDALNHNIAMTSNKAADCSSGSGGNGLAGVAAAIQLIAGCSLELLVFLLS